MRPEERFRRAMEMRLVSEGYGMTCRVESIELAEKAVRALGLTDMVSAHLAAAYGANRLSDLSDDNLRRALRFISILEEQAPPRHLLPLQPGMTADGHWCIFSGRLSWDG